ncbi:MAG: hypothetical protein M1818_002801 [Claussenomyces sp. TS43310]|nr:MAG: hypothetical protein M1818_002801 [Claussenomyces sp. TS43310]
MSPRNPPPGQNSEECSSPQTFEMSTEGHLEVRDSGTNYLGATHWATILENIQDIRGVLEPDMDNIEEISPLTNGPDIGVNASQMLKMADVFNSLPSRAVVDRLLYVYFNAKYIRLPIIHGGKFLREYESFWVDPTSVSFLWISMLFSALHIGAHIDQATGQEVVSPADGPTRQAFLMRAGQALVTGKYHKARPYSLEAVILYGVCKYLQKEDPDTNVWLIMGIGARLAMRMGYHRDPRHLANISPFEGEMRRRTFSVVEAYDLLLSSQAGLPAIIHEEECDTESPSNLFDTDFDEDCKALPTSRPPTDPTPMLYYCYKSRLGKIFRRVMRHALSPKAPQYAEIMKLDGELRAIHADIPPIFRMKLLSSSLMDEAYMILNRLNLNLMYLKCLCVLHRKFLSQDKLDPTFDYSRKTCTDAAMQILTYQADLQVACQPGGQFYSDKWMLSSLTLHDFLLAAMITCLDLYETHQESRSASPEDLRAHVKTYDAIRLSHGIWKSRSAFSRDARRASNVLAVMLSKVPRPNISSTAANAHREISSAPQALISGGDGMGALVNSSASSLWNTIDCESPVQTFPTGDPTSSDLNSAGALNNIFGEPGGIDWGLIDQCLLGQNGIDDVPFDWEPWTT